MRSHRPGSGRLGPVYWRARAAVGVPPTIAGSARGTRGPTDAPFPDPLRLARRGVRRDGRGHVGPGGTRGPCRPRDREPVARGSARLPPGRTHVLHRGVAGPARPRPPPGAGTHDPTSGAPRRLRRRPRSASRAGAQAARARFDPRPDAGGPQRLPHRHPPALPIGLTRRTPAGARLAQREATSSGPWSIDLGKAAVHAGTHHELHPDRHRRRHPRALSRRSGLGPDKAPLSRRRGAKAPRAARRRRRRRRWRDGWRDRKRDRARKREQARARKRGR